MVRHVWTPPLAQVVFGPFWARDRLLSCVRPLIATFEKPLAGMVIRRWGPYQNYEIKALCLRLVEPIPILSIFCPYEIIVPIASPTLQSVVATASADHPRRISVVFPAHDDRPDDPRKLVGQCDGDQHPWLV